MSRVVMNSEPTKVKIFNNTFVSNLIVIYINVPYCLLCIMRKQKKKPSTVKKVTPEVVKLGKRIKAMRVERGYSSAMKFAYDNELSSVQMVRWEQGRNLTFETLVKLARAFKISVSELLKDF